MSPPVLQVEQLTKKYGLDQDKPAKEQLYLASVLLANSEKTTNPPARFAMLRMATDLAVTWGDAKLAVSAIDTIDRDFQIDAIQEKTTSGLGITCAIPPIFEAYATLPSLGETS